MSPIPNENIVSEKELDFHENILGLFPKIVVS